MSCFHGENLAIKQQTPKRHPTLDDVLRKMLSTPPKPHVKAAKKASRRSAVNTRE